MTDEDVAFFNTAEKEHAQSIMTDIRGNHFSILLVYHMSSSTVLISLANYDAP